MATPKIIIQKATAFQLNPEKSYLVHIPDADEEDVKRLEAWFAEHGINDVSIITTETVSISELPKKPNVAQ